MIRKILQTAESVGRLQMSNNTNVTAETETPVRKERMRKVTGGNIRFGSSSLTSERIPAIQS